MEQDGGGAVVGWGGGAVEVGYGLRAVTRLEGQSHT